MRAEAASSGPYVGRRAFGFEDGEVFFGRDSECRELQDLWQRESIIVLHGPAGSGKSSFLRAGVARALQESALVVLSGHASLDCSFPQAALPDYNPYTTAVLSSWYPTESLTGLAAVSITDLLSDKIQELSQSDVALPVYAIIDQLESVFRDSRAQRRREEFFEDLGAAVRIIPQLKIVLAVRSEDLHELDAFGKLLGLRRQSYYELTALDRAAALEAARRPMEETGCPYAESLAELLVDELLTARSLDLTKVPAHTWSEHVQPTQLQVVCSDLSQSARWRELPEHPDAVYLASQVERSLTNFCASIVSEVAAEIGVTPSAVGRWVKRKFITIDGTRANVAESSLASGEFQLAAARALVDQHLLIADFDAVGRSYRLANDRLISAICQVNESAVGDRVPLADTMGRLRAAGSALTAGDLDLAERHAKEALKSTDHDPWLESDAYSLLGNIAYRRGHMDVAEKHYMRAAQLREELQDQPAVGRLLGAIGRIHAMRGRHAAALEELQSAVTRLPGDLALQTEFAKVLSGAGQLQAAAAVFGTILTIEPDFTEALAGRGQIQAERGNASSALDDLQLLIRLRASSEISPGIRLSYALALARTGKTQTAMEEADVALQSAPDSGSIFLRAARVAQAAGSPRRTAELLRKAVSASDPALSSDQLREAKRLMISSLNADGS